MAPRSKMQDIEAEKGKPIRDVLSNLYSIHGKQKFVANELGIDQSTLSIWLVKLGLREKTILVPREKESEQQIA